MYQYFLKIFRVTLLCISCAVSIGCATVPEGHEGVFDPYEDFNRKTHNFNRAADKHLLKPVANGYKAILPATVRKGFNNFFANIGTINTLINDILQGKGQRSLESFSRLFINTTIGIGGLFDVADHWGIPAHSEDFGQTLAVWGVDEGPYLVLPLFGPSNRRDIAGPVVSNLTHPLYWTDYTTLFWGTWTLDIIDTRATLGDIDKALDQALDSYLFERSAFYQYRESAIADGQKVSNSDEFDDFEFEEEFDDFEFEDDEPEAPLNEEPAL